MMKVKPAFLVGISIFLVLISFPSQTFGQNIDEKIFPDWIKQSTTLWLNGQISDNEFLAFLKNILEQNILDEKYQSKDILKDSPQTILNVPELYGEKTSEILPHWLKDRAQWWIEGKITDVDFLRTIQVLKEVGYLEYVTEDNHFSDDQTHQSNLEKFLLNDKEIFNITKEQKWRAFAIEYDFEEKKGVVDYVKIIFSDITRVYEPIFYKFKVPTLAMEILEFDNKNNLKNYWGSFEDKDKQKIFDSAYLIGKPNQNSECLFNYTQEGALTTCIYDNLIVNVMIFDQYGEHYNYNIDKIILDKTEPTTKFTSKILKKISLYKNDYINHQLHDVFQNTVQEENSHESLDRIQTVPKSIEPEKSSIQGVDNFSCVRDDFGLVTVSGQYYNDDVPRSNVELEILFLDKEGNTLGKTSTEFTDLKEFQSKRFVGHSKWNENFHSCQIVLE